MKKVRLPLFSKFAIGISLLVLIFGSFNAGFLRRSVTHLLESEFEKRGFFIARTVAEKAQFFILTDDPQGLKALVNEIKDIDPTIFYVVVIDKAGHILAHTFSGTTIPLWVKERNAEIEPESVSLIDYNNPDTIIRDFRMPVSGVVNTVVRVGVVENEIISNVEETNNQAWIMVGIFLAVGWLAALFFSYTIATPLRVLSRQSKNIDIETIQEGLKTLRASVNKLSFRIRRIFNSHDEIDLLYHNFSSMLERVEQTHHAMNQLQKSLLQSEKMASIGTLTAGVAHEINNPLAGLHIGLNRISRRPDDREQIIKYTSMMKDSLSKMELVVQDLLTFSRESTGKIERTCTCTILRKAIKLARYRHKAQNLTIEFDSQKCPHYIYVNPNRMEQVFLNILFNAIDAISEKQRKMEQEPGIIKILFEVAGDFHYINFMDNGSGIDPGIMGKIFDPFFTTKKIGEGTGLGLAVSYQIVKDHGGDIQVESKPGIGTKVSVVIPRYNPEEGQVN
ncbi:MAG TPA: ATP-binding protein [Bacteroidales bacterium]|nr:ATP-binding protein [Bacteroidales bacterium]